VLAEPVSYLPGSAGGTRQLPAGQWHPLDDLR
jgi:hypothetical protein